MIERLLTRWPSLPKGLQAPLTLIDYVAAHDPDAYVMLMLHPQAIGWGGRMLMLERVVDTMLSRGARFVTAVPALEVTP